MHLDYSILLTCVLPLQALDHTAVPNSASGVRSLLGQDLLTPAPPGGPAGSGLPPLPALPRCSVGQAPVAPERVARQSWNLRWRALPQGSKRPLWGSSEQEDPGPLSSPPLSPGDPTPQVISNICLSRPIWEICMEGAVGIPAHSLGRSLNRLQLLLYLLIPVLEHHSSLLPPSAWGTPHSYLLPQPLPQTHSCPSRFLGSGMAPPAGSLP